MFVKLLKYDMRSVWRIWWIMALSVLGMSVVGGVGLRIVLALIEADIFPFFIFLGFILVFACVMAIVASAVGTELLVFIRFYKNFFTDEGYLTFTLPVSRKNLLFSKTLNALIWTAAQAILMFICIFLVILIGVPVSVGYDFFRELTFTFSALFAEVGLWSVIYALEILFLIICSILFSISLIHFCITMGAMLAKKAKVLAAIGIYYAANMIFSFGTQIIMVIFTLMMSAGLGELLDRAAPAMERGIIAVMLLIACCMMAAISGVMYFITLGKLERNLNLS